MNEYLFSNEYDTISIDELCSYNFDSFKNGNVLNSSFSSVVDCFFDKVYTDSNVIPFYHCLPLLNDLTNEKKYRFLVISIGNDEVFFVYKIIQIVKTKQIRVFDAPISKMDNIDNVKKTIEILYQKKFVRFCFSTSFAKLYDSHIGIAKRLVEYDNYFYYNKKECQTSSKRYKVGANLAESGSGFKVVIDKKPTRKDLMTIRNDFNNYLVSRGSVLNSNDDEEYIKICTYQGEEIRILSFYFDNVLIHISVLYVIEKWHVAYTIYDISLHNYDKTNPTLKRVISHNMTEKVKYYMSLFFPNIDKIYVLGCRPTEHRLLAHKEKICDGKLEYYIK